MNPKRYLTAQLDDEVVALDVERAALVLLDPWSAAVWHACEGRTLEEVSAVVQGEQRRVRHTLQELAEASLVRQDSVRWSRVDVRQV